MEGSDRGGGSKETQDAFIGRKFKFGQQRRKSNHRGLGSDIRPEGLDSKGQADHFWEPLTVY